MSNNTIWDEYKNSLSEFLTEKATGDIIKIKDEGNLKMISHSKMEDNDGLTKARIVDQKKIYTIEFKKSVLRSRFRCWKLALIAHEFCHMLTYADKNVFVSNSNELPPQLDCLCLMCVIKTYT